MPIQTGGISDAMGRGICNHGVGEMTPSAAGPRRACGRVLLPATMRKKGS